MENKCNELVAIILSTANLMTGTDELTLVVQQQLNIYSIVTNDNLSFSMGNLSESILTNRVQLNDIRRKFQISTLTYTIIFGFICACLCFLTVTGNLLVLITFRRVRTVSYVFIEIIVWLFEQISMMFK